MLRYISYKDEQFYTNMLKVILSIGGRKLKYNWLITDIEAYLSDNEELEKMLIYNKFLIFTNDELLDMLEKNKIQWAWGVFSAIPCNFSKEEILSYELPYANENSKIYEDNNLIIQHPLADLEIVAEDASSVFIVAKENIAKLFKKTYPESVKNFSDLLKDC